MPLRLLIVFLLSLLLVACGGRSRDEMLSATAEELYAEARGALERGAYDRAERGFKAINSRFPFGPVSEKAQLGLAYAQYRSDKFDEAQATADRFIRTYPTHPHVDYAHYLRGLINFDRNRGFFNALVASDDAKRDLASSRQAFRDFAELLKRYPDSEYAPDARARMVYLRNLLAEHELQVARYYARRGAWVGVAGRCNHILENYQGTPQSHDALALLVQAYEALGESALSRDTRVVLQRNAPDHPFLTGRSVEQRSWWQRLWPFGEAARPPG